MITEIRQDTIDDVVRFLVAAFQRNRRPASFWFSAVERIAEQNSSYSGAAPVGYCAIRDGKVVSAILVIWDPHGAVFSLSSWASTEGYSADGYRVLRHALANISPGYAVRNVSASPEVVPLMARLGFRKVGTAGIPLTFSFAAMFARFRLKIRGRSCAVYDDENTLVAEYAFLDPTKRLGVRRIALLLRYNSDCKALLSKQISFMNLRGYLVVVPAVGELEYDFRMFAIRRYILMEKQPNGEAAVESDVEWPLNFYGGTEFEVMEF